MCQSQKARRRGVRHRASVAGRVEAELLERGDLRSGAALVFVGVGRGHLPAPVPVLKPVIGSQASATADFATEHRRSPGRESLQLRGVRREPGAEMGMPDMPAPWRNHVARPSADLRRVQTAGSNRRPTHAKCAVLMFEASSGTASADGTCVGQHKIRKIERGTNRGTKRCPNDGFVEYGERFDVQECAPCA